MLGAAMVGPAIAGIQSTGGVIANVKHFVDNSQETERMQVSEVVGERPQFELYYPPFEAAIKAGVGSAMCSYNKASRSTRVVLPYCTAALHATHNTHS